MAKLLTYEILSAKAISQRFPEFRPELLQPQLDEIAVPAALRLLLPYAEIWGVTDDFLRDSLVNATPEELKRNLKAVVANFDDALDEWLAGPEADAASPSPEYLAFSAMRMAADFA